MLESFALPHRRPLRHPKVLPKTLTRAMNRRSRVSPPSAITPMSSTSSTGSWKMTGRLPQELIDRIIDCLWDHRQHLIKCTSVSRSFVRRSQQHLFAKIFLFPSVEQNFEVLLDRSPHLIPYIKELVTAISAVKPTPLVQILPLLTYLKSLTVKTYGGIVVDWDTEIPDVLRDSFGSVFKHNKFRQFVFQDIRNFDVGLLEKCPSIRSLVIAGGGTLAMRSSRRSRRDTPPELSTLMIGPGTDSLKSLVDCIAPDLPALSLRNLQWLSIRELQGQSWTSSFNALVKFMPSLAHLVIDLEARTWSRRPESENPIISLSTLTFLSTLELRNAIAYDQTPFSEKSAAILRTLPLSSKLVQLTLYCPGAEFADYNTPSSPTQWKAVNDALAFTDIASLRQVHFKLGPNIFPTQVAGFNLLPWANSRGVMTRISKMVVAA